MSKNIVSGAVALMMMVMPVSASALSQSSSFTMPTIPQNATVQDLLNIVAQLQAILVMLLSNEQPVIEEPLNCPVYNAPLCGPNEHLVAGEYQPNGCQAGPRCVANSPADASTASITFWGDITNAVYRMGTAVDWNLTYSNAPSDSNICLVIQSITNAWEGGFQGFGGSDGCYYASGNGSRSFHAVLGSKPGFDFKPGQYRLVAKLIKAATGNFSPYAVAYSGTFTVIPAYEDAPIIKLTGPANGSVYKVGDTIPVTFSYADAPANAQIIIKTENIQTSNPPSGAVSAGQWQSPMLVQGSGSGTYTWQTGPSMTDLTGIYRITAWMRECDPRGCSWNADFPGSPYPVRTLASAPNNITITLNSALTGNPSGVLTVGTDASSPALQMVSAGATGVTLGVYKLRASGEAININKLNVFLSTDGGGSGNPANIQQLYVYSGSALIGSGVFPGLGQNATITLSSPLNIARDTDARITIKADLARVGTGQPGVAGSLIKLQLASAAGTGVSSGSYIGGNNNESFGKEGTGGVAGVRIQRSYPIVASVPLPSSAGVQDGKLIRFTITANSNGRVNIGRLNFRLAMSGATASNVQLYGYTDSSYSAPIPGSVYGGQISNANRMSDALVSVYPFENLAIPAGATYYFELRGNVVTTTSNSAITTTLLSDGNSMALVPFNALGDTQFAWSPNSQGAVTLTSADWTNGFMVPGLPTSGISQTRTNGGQLPPPTGNPRVLLGAVTSSNVSVDYIDMPANTQFVLINQITGARIESVSSFVQSAGSGSATMPFPQGTAAGTYYVRAQNYSTQAYIAQTIVFTFGGTPSAQPTITVTNKTRPFIRFHIDNVPGGVQGVYLTGETTNTNVASTNILTNSGDGTIVMSDVSPSGMYYLRLLAVVNNEILAKSASFYVAPIVISCPMYSIMQCPVGQHMVSDPSTYDANQCEIPHMHCVPDTVTAAPTCNVTATPSTITQGQSVTFTWTSANGSNATFNGGAVQLNGSQTMTWAAGAGTFNMPLVVTGAGGTATCNGTVNVNALTGTAAADIKANGSDGPITVAYGESPTISWTTTAVTMCGIAPTGPSSWAGNFGTSGSKPSGALTQTISYILQCSTAAGGNISDTVVVNVSPKVETGTCTYTPGAVRGAPPSDKSPVSVPVTIQINGGQAACSSWCSSQAAEANVYYTCAYNGAQITMINRNAQLASALTAVQDAVKWLISFFKKQESPAADVSVSTTSAPQKWGPTAPTNTQPAAAPTGTLHAVFKGTAIPDVMNVTKEIAQKLCRPDATCTWNGEPIVSEGYAPTPGGYTITFTMPAPASKQTLASGTGYTFEISDNSSMTGAVTQDSYRLYFAKYTSKVGPDVIYQAKLSGVNRTLSGAVQLKWDGMIINPDGSTAKLPAGFYYAGAVNAKNALKGGSTGSITVTQ